MWEVGIPAQQQQDDPSGMVPGGRRRLELDRDQNFGIWEQGMNQILRIGERGTNQIFGIWEHRMSQTFGI